MARDSDIWQSLELFPRLFAACDYTDLRARLEAWPACDRPRRHPRSSGYVGLDDSGPDADPAVITGYKAARNRPLTRRQKLSYKALAAVPAPVEHGFAHLKN